MTFLLICQLITLSFCTTTFLLPTIQDSYRLSVAEFDLWKLASVQSNEYFSEVRGFSRNIRVLQTSSQTEYTLFSV